MEDEGPVKHDFVTETKGQCFLCSKNTSPWYSSTRQESPSIYSLHCLASYLKIDMEKVFTGNEPIPAHLVERVKMSRLKAELCGECTVLNDRFSKVFRQLEKMEMEATSCLGIIQQKLEKAVKFDKAHNWNGDSNDQWISKLEISEALRKDAMQKCSRKLKRSIIPVARIKRLTRQQISAEKGKINSKNVTGSDRQLDANPYSATNYEHDDDGGSPASIPEESYHETDRDKICMDFGNDYVPEGIPDSETKFDPIEKSWNDTPITGSIRSNGRNEQSNTEKDQLSRAIPPPLAISKGVGIDAKPKSIKNTETGKFKCPICSKEYPHLSSFKLHYNSAHLKIRYTCGTCKRDFPQKHVYERHYLSIHMGVRFKCGQCNKMFTQEGQLKQHQNKFHKTS